MNNLKFSGKIPEVGDLVAVFFHNGSTTQVFEILIGVLTRLDEDYPSGSIDNKEIDFASEGHSSFIRVIKP